jgi:hypothetical protein
MNKLRFKFIPERKKSYLPARGWIVLGDHAIDEDGDHLLSSECVTVSEVEYHVKRLKKQLDLILFKARGRLK